MSSEGRAGATVELTHHFHASPEAVFDAWVDPETLARWFCGSKAQTAEAWTCPHAGGCYLVVMRGDGRDWPHAGHYTCVERPERLSFSWYTPSTDNQRSDVALQLEAEAGGTRLVLTHRGLPTTLRGDFEAGWRELLEQLAALLRD